MSAINSLLQNLSDEQQEFVESWLVRFEQAWDETSLSHQAHGLPADAAVRRPLLVEMVKIDLERQWQRGRRTRLEDYLRDHPDLGVRDSVPVDLLQAEYEVRQQFDQTADLADYARRFPHQVEMLRQLLADAPPSWLETANPDPTWVKAGSLSTLGSDGERDRQELPEQFGRYRVLKQLGRGGMGAVYLAHDTQLDRPVALKVPTFSGQDDPSALERFYREARAAATLSHPNLCPVHDVGEIAGTHYLTMAYVEGDSLAEQIKKGLTPSPREAATLVRKVAMAMAEAHAHGVIHRDLKPSNIMLNHRGDPVVMDFGLAHRVRKEDVRLTQAGSLIGTPAYMPPEQVAGDLNRMGPASDVYSLGVILYELLTGKLPFSGSVGEVMAAILTKQPRPPSALRPEVDPRLGAICLKAMARDSADRYAGMAEFAAALDAYLNTSAAGNRPSRTPLALAVALLVALLGAGAYFLATVVFRVETKDGVLIVETEDDVQLRVTQDGKQVTLIDTRTKKEVALKAGAYEVELVGGKEGLKLKTNRFEIEQGGRRIALVSFEPRQGKPIDGPAKVRPMAETRRFTGFPGAVESVVFAADGKRAYGAGVDESIPGCSHAVRAWDLETGKPSLNKPRGHLCNWIVLARDGLRYLEGGGLAFTRAYDVDPHQELRTFRTGPHVSCGAFSSDGRRIILSVDLVLQKGTRYTVRVYDLSRGNQLADLRHPEGEARCVALSPDGKRAFSANKASVQLWDVETGKGRPAIAGAQVASAEFSPDGKYLLTGDAFGTIRLLKADNGEEIRTFEEKHTSAVACLAFSADSKRVVSGSGDRTVRLWDVATGKEIQSLTGHDDKVTAVAFSADGGRLLSGSADKTIRLWDAVKQK